MCWNYWITSTLVIATTMVLQCASPSTITLSPLTFSAMTYTHQSIHVHVTFTKEVDLSSLTYTTGDVIIYSSVPPGYAYKSSSDLYLYGLDGSGDIDKPKAEGHEFSMNVTRCMVDTTDGSVRVVLNYRDGQGRRRQISDRVIVEDVVGQVHMTINQKPSACGSTMFVPARLGLMSAECNLYGFYPKPTDTRLVITKTTDNTAHADNSSVCNTTGSTVHSHVYRQPHTCTYHTDLWTDAVDYTECTGVRYACELAGLELCSVRVQHVMVSLDHGSIKVTQVSTTTTNTTRLTLRLQVAYPSHIAQLQTCRYGRQNTSVSLEAEDETSQDYIAHYTVVPGCNNVTCQAIDLLQDKITILLMLSHCQAEMETTAPTIYESLSEPGTVAGIASGVVIAVIVLIIGAASLVILHIKKRKKPTVSSRMIDENTCYSCCPLTNKHKPIPNADSQEFTSHQESKQNGLTQHATWDPYISVESLEKIPYADDNPDDERWRQVIRTNLHLQDLAVTCKDALEFLYVLITSSDDVKRDVRWTSLNIVCKHVTVTSQELKEVVNDVPESLQMIKLMSWSTGYSWRALRDPSGWKFYFPDEP